MLQENVLNATTPEAYLLYMHSAFEYAPPWSILDLEYYSRHIDIVHSIMILEHILSGLIVAILIQVCYREEYGIIWMCNV